MSKKQLVNDLIASINHESRRFNMTTYAVGDVHKPATCKTARCMAGHLIAIRPKLAKEIIAEAGFGWTVWTGKRCFKDDRVAREIWRRETGEECRLDFQASNHPFAKDSFDTHPMSAITRADAVAHIRGRSKRWPLLPKNSNK